MNERYLHLYRLPGLRYAPDASVVIAAGALLKDTVSGRVLAQLKMESLIKHQISAVQVEVSCFDPAKKPLGEEISHLYLDINCGRGTFFGQRTPIFLPTATRFFNARISRVIYADCEEENPAVNGWMFAPAARRLEETLGPELAEQYKRDVSSAKYEPVELEGKWVCTCGAMNRGVELKCGHCPNGKVNVFSAIDITTLRRNLQRYEEEQERAREQARREAERVRIEKLRKRRKRRIITAVCLLAVVLLGAAGAVFGYVLPERNYRAGLAMMEEGRYGEAVTVFEKIYWFRDGEEKYLEAWGLNEKQKQYRQVLDLYAAKEYVLAAELLKELPPEMDTEGIAEKLGVFFPEKGMIFEFGSYQGEPVKWYVLETEDDAAFVVCADVIGNARFHNEKSGAPWSKSSLRVWMNGELLEDMFEEQWMKDLIMTSDVSAAYNKYGSRKSSDRIFLLNRSEVQTLLPKEMWDVGVRAWMLRDTNDDYCWAVLNGRMVSRKQDLEYGVRPAMWIKIAK